MESDDGLEEEGPFFAWLPPDDRLWRHPSEVPAHVAAAREGHGSGSRAGMSSLLVAGAQNPITRIWTIAVVAGIVGALAASGIGMMTGAFEQQATVVRSVVASGPSVTLTSVAASPVGWTAINQDLAPSVIDIDVSTASGPASGSGLLYGQGNHEAYALTDSSLVSQASDIRVTYLSGVKYPARVVGQDRLTGLALIAIPTSDSTFPQLGSVTGLQVANQVMAVGAGAAPGGSVFEGLVTAADRQVDVTGGFAMQNLIAVSGPPLPSAAAGGPLVNQQGEVVGITLTLDPINNSDQPLTFAVPVDVAKHVAEQLLEGTAVTHPWLGVSTASDITSSLARQFGLAGGARVDQVSPGSPASQAGLTSSDIITALNDRPVTSPGTLTQLLCQAQLGRRMVISYLHQGKPVQASVLLWNQPDGD